MTTRGGTLSDFTVGPEEQGLRLDVYLSRKDATVSRSQARRLIDDGEALVDGRPARASHRVRPGERVSLRRPPPRSSGIAPEEIPLAILYEDDALLVVDKPAGMVVHPAAGNPRGTLVNALQFHCGTLSTVGGLMRPGIVHRLDKGTSGLLVVARNQTAFDSLVDQLATHDVDRRYRALVHGHLDTARGTVDAPVGRSRRDPLRMTVSANGRPARTHYELIASFDAPGRLSLLECRLETGRTHQIRVHLRSIGRPVVGDELYGGARGPLRLDRPFLHAVRLGFHHPGTGSAVSFESPLPTDLVEVLSGLG